MLNVSLTQADGSPLIFLGLTNVDLSQLRNRQTLALNLPELGLPRGRAFLMYREEIATLHREMKAAGLPVADLPTH